MKKIKGFHTTYDKEDIITAKQYARVNNIFSGMTGATIKSQKNSKYDYEIKVNVMNVNFNWLNWQNRYKTVWEIALRYTFDFNKWVKDRYGIDLIECKFNDFLDFAVKTGLVKIRGNPPPHAFYAARQILAGFKYRLMTGDMG